MVFDTVIVHFVFFCLIIKGELSIVWPMQNWDIGICFFLNFLKTGFHPMSVGFIRKSFKKYFGKVISALINGQGFIHIFLLFIDNLYNLREIYKTFFFLKRRLEKYLRGLIHKIKASSRLMFTQIPKTNINIFFFGLVDSWKIMTEIYTILTLS